MRLELGMDQMEDLVPLKESAQAALASFLFNLVPVAGPTALAAVTAGAQARWNNRVTLSFDEVCARISALEARVYRDYVSSAEFGDLFTEALIDAGKTESEEVRRLYTSPIVAAALVGPGSQIMARRVRRRVEALDPYHFKLLRAYVSSKSPLGESKPLMAHNVYEYGARLLADDVTVEGRRVSTVWAHGLVEDLLNEGLLRNPRPQVIDGGTLEPSFGPEEAEKWLTRNGLAVVEFLWPEEFL